MATTKERFSSSKTPSLFKMLWSKREGREARESRAPFFHFLWTWRGPLSLTVAAAGLLGGGTLSTVWGPQVLAILPTHVLVFDADQSQPGSHPRHGAERTAAGRSLNSGRSLVPGAGRVGARSFLPAISD